MNQKNFEYLNDQLKYNGFGQVQENELKGKMEKSSKDFQIEHKTKFGNDDVSAVLYFKKSEQSDMYFFNRYDATLKPEETKENMTQTFYINKGKNNITLKEAYNLMNGRAVHKELSKLEKVGEGETERFKPTDEKYTAWVKLDFKEADEHGNFKHIKYTENYGYDMKAVLAKFPIKELENDKDKTTLLNSLEKGNRQSVTFVQNGKEQLHFIEANPKFKMINVYDSHMQRLDMRNSKTEKQSVTESQSAKQKGKRESQTASGDDHPEIPKAANKRKKRQAPSI